MRREERLLVRWGFPVAFALFVGLIFLTIAIDARANDGFDWERIVVVEDVTIIYEKVSSWELREMRRAYSARGGEPGAFAVLSRNTATGEYICRVYFAKGTKAVLEHERRHCYGWAHR